MSRVYIAGPMTGRPLYNHAEFMSAATRFREAGWDVVTPFECNSAVWRKHYGRDFDPTRDTCDYGDPILAEMLLEDLRALVGADAVAVLDGWERSKGATLEVLLAQNLGKQILVAATLSPLQANVQASVTRTDETAVQEAQRLVHGDRGADYGHPIDDYTVTGTIWGALLRAHKYEGGPVPPRLAVLMMAGVKMSREAHKPKRDNRVDLAGYAECAEMIAQREARDGK